jgi:FLVCR family feline leukemia virus subgroup C receptor-related protein
VSVEAVNVFAQLCFALYLPGSALQLHLVEARGVRGCLLAASAACTAALGVRTAALTLPGVPARAAYAAGLAAQALAGVAQPLALNLASRVAGDWFPASERDVATAVLVSSNALGQLSASAAAPWLVRTPAQLQRALAPLLALSAATTAAAATLLRERPAAPPSAAAAAQWRARSSGGNGLAAALHDAHALGHDRNFVRLAAAFAVSVGTVWAMLFLEAQLLAPCGYDAALAGAAGASLLAAGTAATLAAGALLRATHAYLPLQRTASCAAAVAAVAVFAASGAPAAPHRVVLAWAALGAAAMPLLPLTLEHAAEMVHPLPADAAAAVLFAGANAFGLMYSLALAPMLRGAAASRCGGDAPAAWLTGALMAAAAATTLSLRRQYRRSAAERPDCGDDAPLLAGGTAQRYERGRLTMWLHVGRACHPCVV